MIIIVENLLPFSRLSLCKIPLYLLGRSKGRVYFVYQQVCEVGGVVWEFRR